MAFPDDFVAYIRAPGPIAPPGAMVADVIGLLDVPEESLESLAADFSQYPGFLGEKVQRQLIENRIQAPEKRRHIANFMRWAKNYIGPLDVAENAYREAGKAAHVENLDKFVAVVTILLKPFPALARQIKAEQLAAKAGMRAESIDLICDIRPVFDQARTAVEAVIPFTTLRIVAVDIGKLPVVFELTLSAKDVQDLRKKVDDTIQKLNAIGKLTEDIQLRIPDVDLTQTEK